MPTGGHVATRDNILTTALDGTALALKQLTRKCQTYIHTIGKGIQTTKKKSVKQYMTEQNRKKGTYQLHDIKFQF